MPEERKPAVVGLEEVLSKDPAKSYEEFERTLQEEIAKTALEELEGRGYVGWKQMNEMYLELSTAEQWELLKPLIQQYGAVAPYIGFFEDLDDNEILQYASELGGTWMIEDFDLIKDQFDDPKIFIPQLEQAAGINTVLDTELRKNHHLMDIIKEQFPELDFANIEDWDDETKQSLLQLASEMPAGAILASNILGYNSPVTPVFPEQEGAVGNRPLYREGFAEEMIRVLSPMNLGVLQEYLVRGNHLSAIGSWTYGEIGTATIQALEAAFTQHNLSGRAPELDDLMKTELIQNQVTPATFDFIFEHLKKELVNDETANEEKEAQAYYAKPFLTDSTDQVFRIGGEVIGRNIDYKMASELSDIFDLIKRSKYDEVLETQLELVKSNREKELFNLQRKRQAKHLGTDPTGLKTDIVEGLDAAEVEQEAEKLANIEFSRRLQDTYFKQEIDDNERRYALNQASLGFNNALRNLGGPYG
mgnify:CR=1 FL=1